MAPAHGRTSLNERSDIGATSPGRWHPAHLAKTIGATSRLNVGVLVAAAPALWGAPLAATSAVPAPTRVMARTSDLNVMLAV